jgi:hypothetical protein
MLIVESALKQCHERNKERTGGRPTKEQRDEFVIGKLAVQWIDDVLKFEERTEPLTETLTELPDEEKTNE